MAGRYDVDDSGWLEVMVINGYAVFLGYLLMGVRALGVLIVTWTTVVLLGGFVSDLQNKDFWCLTAITLIQTAGVFNFLLKEKLRDVLNFLLGLSAAMLATFGDEEREPQTKNQVIAFILLVIEALVLIIILCPLGVLYLLGLYISAGVSLWRLIEPDFSNTGGANQKAALQVLYSLAVAQCVLFGYKTIYALGARNRLAKIAATGLGTVDEELVAEYLEETVAGCEKEPSFARGRNLVTHAVDLMEAKSNESFIAGIRVLNWTIKDQFLEPENGRKVLAKQLLTRLDSWSHMMQRLLEAVGPRSPYSREVREHVLSIMDFVVRGIHLEQFPRAIECMSSMLEEYNQQLDSRYGDNRLKDYERVELLEGYERDYLTDEPDWKDSPDIFVRSLIQWLVQCLLCKREATKSERKEIIRRPVKGFDALLTEAVSIIHQLAADEGNRGIMSRDTVLQRKIAMAPLRLHRDNHDACSLSQRSELKMVEKCWALTGSLVATTAAAANRSGETIIQVDVAEGEGEGRLLSMVGNAIINSVKSIFDCLDCRATQKKQAIQILLHLSLDMSSIMDGESRKRRLTWILLLISQFDFHDSGDWMVSGFTYGNNKSMLPDVSSIKSLAGEKLSDMLREKHGLPSEESMTELQSIRLALGDIASAFSDDDEEISDRTHAAIIMEGLYAAACLLSYTSNAYMEARRMFVGVIPKVVNEILIRCASQAQPAHDVEEGDVSKDAYTDNERLRKSLVSLCRNMGHFAEFEKTASKICEEQGKSLKYFESLLV